MSITSDILADMERAAFLDAAGRTDRPVRTQRGVLHFTGCRISEALSLTPRHVDLSARAVFETLKKRPTGLFRSVPVPPSPLSRLDMVRGTHERQKHSQIAVEEAPLWHWHLGHTWRLVKAVMHEAGILDRPHTTPKGLRHGAAAIISSIPLNMLSKWIRHASLEVTAIYANALGTEERSVAERMRKEAS